MPGVSRLRTLEGNASMPVKRLKRFVPVPVERPKLERCEYDCTSNPDWREYVHRNPGRNNGKYASGRMMQCTFDGVVEIDGKPYCRKHAGFIALDKWLEGKLVEA